uniref:Uncharacterized protein n=1 Tax=Timema poppense TaxID=170557 RepID=A0A7R9DMW3_TIMPO|nr:unnamed protein product [Timema poppensis]
MARSGDGRFHNELSCSPLQQAALSSDPTTSTWLLEAPEGLPLRSDVTLRGPVLVWERGTRILSEVYFASQHTPVVSRRFQGWTPGGGFLEGLCGGEDTLEGLTLRSAIFNNPSVAWIGKNHSVEGGFGVEIWKCLGTSLNFKIDWVVVDKELSWGRQLPDKSWTGVMGLIERKEVDIAVNSFSISEERLTVADFSSHFCFFAGKIHMKKPNSYEMGWKKLLSHTKFSVISVTLAGLLLLLSASLAVSSRILITSRNASNETVSLYDSVFLTWSALLCNQGQDGVPRSVTCRLVYLVSCLGGILLLTFYSAKIISVMTAKYNKLPFTSLKGLIKDGSYKLTISRNSNEYFMFANAKSGIYKEMYDTVMSHNPDDMPATTYEGSKMICQDDKIVIIFSNLFSYTTSIPCVFAVVPEVIYQFSQHYLFQKGSPFTGIVSRK